MTSYPTMDAWDYSPHASHYRRQRCAAERCPREVSFKTTGPLCITCYGLEHKGHTVKRGPLDPIKNVESKIKARKKAAAKKAKITKIANITLGLGAIQ